MGLALKMWFAHLFLVIGALMSTSNAAQMATTGPCKDAKPGQTKEKCSMECNKDGSCTETLKTEECECNGKAVFETTVGDYKDGKVKTGLAPTPENSVCDQMSARCSSCKGSLSGGRIIRHRKDEELPIGFGDKGIIF